MTKRKRKGKGAWSPEARERFSELMKERSKKKLVPLAQKPIIDNSFLTYEERISQEEDMKTEKYIAKREFDYDTGIHFEHGEIVELRNLPNDDKLQRLGFVLPYKTTGSESSCIQCGKEFGSTSGYNMHVAKHYEQCIRCNKKVPQEQWQRHLDAHAELTV